MLRGPDYQGSGRTSREEWLCEEKLEEQEATPGGGKQEPVRTTLGGSGLARVFKGSFRAEHRERVGDQG